VEKRVELENVMSSAIDWLRVTKEFSEVERNLSGEVPRDDAHEQLVELRRVWGVQDDPKVESK